MKYLFSITRRPFLNITFGEEGEMDFDVVFVHFLTKKEDLFASIYGATVVAVLEDLEVWVTLFVSDDVAHHWSEGEKAFVSFKKDLKHV